MNELTNHVLFRNRLPPLAPTVLQLAGRAIEADRRFKRVVAAPCATPDWQFTDLEQEQADKADAFFAALYEETGIDREMIAKLGAMA